MTDDYSYIAEDDGGDSQHLLLSVSDYLGCGDGDATLNSYLNLGDWAPSDTTIVLDAAFVDPLYDEDGVEAPNGYVAADNSSVDGYSRDNATGDDLLIAFLYNSYLDDTRERYDSVTDDDSAADELDADIVASPGVDYSALVQPPGIDDVAVADYVTHGGAGAYFYYDETLRSQLTKNMPKHVGWRDHTEGHRITTTRGDKIEVIGGNYKLVVLGRGQGTVHTDWSGGHVVDTLEAAGNVSSISWRKVPTMVDDSDERGWQWVEETLKGNVIERFHGSVRTEQYGDEIITLIGSSDELEIRDYEAGLADANEAIEEAAEDEDAEGDDAEDDDEAESAEEIVGSVPGNWSEVDDWVERENYWDETFVADDASSGIPLRTRPEIIERKWVCSLYSFEHFSGDKIDIENAGDTIDDYVGCEPDGRPRDGKSDGDSWFIDMAGTIDTWQWGRGTPDALSPAKIKGDDPSDGPELRRTVTLAEGIREQTIAEIFVEERECDLYIGNYQGADGSRGTHVIENWIGNTFELFIGARESMFFGLNVSTTLGATNTLAYVLCMLDVVTGPILECRVDDKRADILHAKANVAALRADIADARHSVARADSYVTYCRYALAVLKNTMSDMQL